MLTMYYHHLYCKNIFQHLFEISIWVAGFSGLERGNVNVNVSGVTQAKFQYKTPLLSQTKSLQKRREPIAILLQDCSLPEKLLNYYLGILNFTKQFLVQSHCKLISSVFLGKLFRVE